MSGSTVGFIMRNKPLELDLLGGVMVLKYVSGDSWIRLGCMIHFMHIWGTCAFLGAGLY